jgi:hypothetical protein
VSSLLEEGLIKGTYSAYNCMKIYIRKLTQNGGDIERKAQKNKRNKLKSTTVYHVGKWPDL